MRRRDFLALFGAATGGWSFSAHGQESAKKRLIGFLGPSSLSLEHRQVAAFLDKLKELGHVEGETLAVEFAWAEGHDDRLAVLAEELVRLKPDVIVTTGTPGTLAAKRATSNIPIVFASSGNPITAGLVQSLSRPGGNITGMTYSGPELEGKRVQLVMDLVPNLSRIAVIRNPTNPGSVGWYEQTRGAAAALGVTLDPVTQASQASELKKAFAVIANAKPHAMMAFADRFLLAHREEIVNFAAKNRLPATYPYLDYVEAGGLMSYAPSEIDQFHRTASYVDKILRGAKPEDLPVQEPVKFEFAINLKTAKALGLTIPPTLLARADEMIE
jgi:ABC-type uncharacterized transport system substrate-binding protein